MKQRIRFFMRIEGDEKPTELSRKGYKDLMRGMNEHNPRVPYRLRKVRKTFFNNTQVRIAEVKRHDHRSN